MRAQILLVGEAADVVKKLKGALADFDTDIAVVQPAHVGRALAQGMRLDLAVFDAHAASQVCWEVVELLADNHRCPLLFVAGEQDIERIELPAHVAYDFVSPDAGRAECLARVRRLLGSMTDAEPEVVTEGDLSVNLSTFQVTIGNTQVDLAYLEYVLLSFLVRHPRHAFSRDALLKNVWGAGYSGGARTVDVHVCRVRSKLGPELGNCLETVRGVGYLWNPPE